MGWVDHPCFGTSMQQGPCDRRGLLASCNGWMDERRAAPLFPTPIHDQLTRDPTDEGKRRETLRNTD